MNDEDLIEDTLYSDELAIESFEELSEETIEELLSEPNDDNLSVTIEDIEDNESDTDFFPGTETEDISAADSTDTDETIDDAVEELSSETLEIPDDIITDEQLNDNEEISLDVLESPEENIPDFLSIEKTDWSPDYNALDDSLSGLSHGIELPAEIFSLSVRHLSVKSGLFLTFEKSNDIFSPFSSIGIDQTSLRRCKISTETLKDNKIIMNGETVHINADKTFLKGFLSKRLWDSIENLAVLVFSYHDINYGLLLIFNSEVSEKADFKDFASSLIKNTSETLHMSRSSVINNLDVAELPAPVDLSEASENITNYIETIDKKQKTTAKLIFINYTSLIDSVTKLEKTIDFYVLERDIYKMYYSMLGSNGIIQRISSHSLLLLYLYSSDLDTSIILNQFQTSLLSLFKVNIQRETPDIIVKEVDLSEENCSESIAAACASFR